MTDFEELGFKAGLEIHQQLSGKKLFCGCPAVIREDEPDFCVERVLRASSGESGETDVAAAHEQRKRKRFVYQGYQDSTCLVELDEEPVSHPDPEAVETAVMAARMLDMHFFDEVHVMRKVVVDGSNTAGFQRTMSVASDGVLGDVRINRLCLEEDSAKIVERGQQRDVYNLSRLGIPLLEITTKPDITSPEQLQQVAGDIGMVLRSTGRVKRGLGTIRQDVNISVSDGTRVEVKGVQDLQSMPQLAANEALRQQGLADLSQELDAVVVSEPVVVSDALSGASGWVGDALGSGDAVVGVRVDGFSGVLGRELFGGFRVGTELAGYAKAWGFGGVIHGDEDSAKYGLDSWAGVREALGASAGDGFVLLVGDERRASEALAHVIKQRLEQFCVGVPACVRKANDDASTTYLRPMPGAARMYPETDVRPFSVAGVDVELPELLTDKAARLAEEYDVNEDVAWQLCRQDRSELFERWAGRLPASLVADVLVVKEKELRRRHDVVLDVEGVAEELFERLAADDISKSAVEDALLMYAERGSVDWSSFETLGEQEIRSVVQDVVAADPNAPFGALMGQAMGRLQGKADGEVVSKVLREELG